MFLGDFGIGYIHLVIAESSIHHQSFRPTKVSDILLINKIALCCGCLLCSVESYIWKGPPMAYLKDPRIIFLGRRGR